MIFGLILHEARKLYHLVELTSSIYAIENSYTNTRISFNL